VQIWAGRFDSLDFCNAYFREELKGVGINPEITIQNKAQDNRSNPHWTQEVDKIKKISLATIMRTEYFKSGKINMLLM
jgi:hypothetical protein